MSNKQIYHFDTDCILKLKYRKENVSIDDLSEEDIAKLARSIISCSIRGILQFNCYRVIQIQTHTYTPFRFIWEWLTDICANSNKKRKLWKIFKDVIKEYFDIDNFDQFHFFIKDKKNICRNALGMNAEKFKKYCLFDVEKMYQDGIVNEEVLNKKFDHNKKYYIINEKNPCVYDKELTYDELVEMLTDKYEYCTMPFDNVISIYFEKNGIVLFENFIVAEDYFDDMKSVDEHLSEINFDKCDVEYLKKIFSADKVVEHMSNFYQLNSEKTMKKFAKILKCNEYKKKLTVLLKIVVCSLNFQEVFLYLQQIDNFMKDGGGYFTNYDWMSFGRYVDHRRWFNNGKESLIRHKY